MTVPVCNANWCLHPDFPASPGPSNPWYQQRNGKWIANARGPADPIDSLFHYDPYVNAASTPQFDFGFGLGFAEFAYGKTTVTKTSATELTVSTVVHNIGKVDAVETAQVYVTAPLDTVVRYYKRLAGFTKVLVRAGSSTTVAVAVLVDDLAVYATATPGSPGAGTRRLLPGTYTFGAGHSSSTAASTATVEL